MTDWSVQEDFDIFEKASNYLNKTKKFIKIEGNCDQVGSKKHNLKLRLSRAKFVKNYLIKKLKRTKY